MKNKIKKLDGIPGLTLQGIKGATGERGNRVFHSYHNQTIEDYQTATGGVPFSYPVYDMWLIGSSMMSPIVAGNKNYYYDITPIPHDHIIYTQSQTTYLYEVLDYSKMDDRYAPSILMDKQIQAIREYYMNVNNVPDVCIVRYLDSFAQNDITVSVVITDKAIGYDAWDGALNPTNNKAVKYSDTVNLLSFEVISGNDNPIGDIKITAEFIPSEYNALMSSTMPQLWDISSDEVQPGTTVPTTGYPWKYSNELNFDNENLRNFTAVIKDWNDGSKSYSYMSPFSISKDSIADYTIVLFAYTDNGIYKSKTYIGEFDFTSF